MIKEIIQKYKNIKTEANIVKEYTVPKVETVKLEGNTNKNVATYNIIYDPTDKPVDESSVNI